MTNNYFAKPAPSNRELSRYSNIRL